MTYPSPSSTYPQQSGDPEATLRLLAQLPPPNGLADRVHRSLANAPGPSAASGFWSLWRPVHRLQFAAAAVLVTAMAASSWTILASRHPATPATKAVAPAPAPQPSAFSTAGAEHRPSTLKPIKVPPPPKASAVPGKKPSAAKSRALRPSDQAGATAH